MPDTEVMRTVGVEEELLLIDETTGEPVAVADAALARARTGTGTEDDNQPGGTVDAELQQHQLEIDTTPVEQLSELGEHIRAARARADLLGRKTGARIAALATSPLAVPAQPTSKPRYGRMVQHLGLTGLEELTCGCHVHVSIESPEEGVAVLDRIRAWLPILLALSANSPYWQGLDSGYASFRSQVWNRLPTSGPTDVYGSAAAYQGLVDAIIGSGVALDTGMIYFDARMSARYPTVEIRVADVCLNADDTVLIAALARALVETAVTEWCAGVPPLEVNTELIRLASWRAGRSGLTGELLDAASGRPRPAGEVVAALLAHVSPALASSGDLPLVTESVERLVVHGTGADLQREMFARSGDLHRLALDAADYTLR